IENNAGTDGLAGQAGTAAAGRDRHTRLAADLHSGDDVFDAARDDDAEWLGLVNAGVGAVQGTGGGVEADLALQVRAQVPGQNVAAHGGEVVHEIIVPVHDRAGKASVPAPWLMGKKKRQLAEFIWSLLIERADYNHSRLENSSRCNHGVM